MITQNTHTRARAARAADIGSDPRKLHKNVTDKSIGGSKGIDREAHPFSVQLFFIFMQFLEENGQNNRFAQPPSGNPGSANEIL